MIISARKGEFETGFEKGGQTREHAMLVKTQGIKRLVVAINKMDDPTVEVKFQIFFSIFSLKRLLVGSRALRRNRWQTIPMAFQTSWL